MSMSCLPINLSPPGQILIQYPAKTFQSHATSILTQRETLKFAPSRIHIWVVAIRELKTLKEPAESFLESETWMTMLSPDPDGPDALSQAPQVALLQSGNLRIVLLRKLFPTKMSENPLSQKAGTPWIRPSLIPGGRWKAKGIASDEDAPPLLVPGPLLFDLVLGNVSIEQFDALMYKEALWNLVS